MDEADLPAYARAPPPRQPMYSSSDDSDNDVDAELLAMMSRVPRKVKEEEAKAAEARERNKKEAKADQGRLAEVRRKREEARQKRIAEEGWDRFAPMTKTNHPPGHDVSKLPN